MQTIAGGHAVPQPSDDQSNPVVDAELERARLQKLYIQIHLSKLRAEIKAFVEQRTKIAAKPQTANAQAAARETIHIRQHLLSLRSSLHALEEEQKSVLQILKRASAAERRP